MSNLGWQERRVFARGQNYALLSAKTRVRCDPYFSRTSHSAHFLYMTPWKQFDISYLKPQPQYPWWCGGVPDQRSRTLYKAQSPHTASAQRVAAVWRSRHHTFTPSSWGRQHWCVNGQLLCTSLSYIYAIYPCVDVKLTRLIISLCNSEPRMQSIKLSSVGIGPDSWDSSTAPTRLLFRIYGFHTGLLITRGRLPD